MIFSDIQWYSLILHCIYDCARDPRRYELLARDIQNSYPRFRHSSFCKYFTHLVNIYKAKINHSWQGWNGNGSQGSPWKHYFAKKSLSRRRGRTSFLKLVHTFACLTVSKTSSRLHLHWIGWRSCFHVLPCEPVQICSQGYMITCLHVLKDPNKSTILIYSATPLTLYFVNIFKGVTETIKIEMSTVSKYQSLMMV